MLYYFYDVLQFPIKIVQYVKKKGREIIRRKQICNNNFMHNSVNTQPILRIESFPKSWIN